MKGPIGADIGPGLQFSTDRIAMNIHGNADSHIDALNHVVFEGKLHNGLAGDKVLSQNGALVQSIDVAAAGIVGRGVLMDMRGSRRALAGAGRLRVDRGSARGRGGAGRPVGRGDVLYLRVGHHRRRLELGPWDAAVARAGLHSSAMQLLHDRRIAAFGADGDSDAVPNACRAVDLPVHVLGVNAIGLHFMDSLQFEELATACAGPAAGVLVRIARCGWTRARARPLTRSRSCREARSVTPTEAW